MVEQPDSSAPGGGREGAGGELLARISNEMVSALKEFFGKGTAEKTMLEFGQEDQVRRFRQLFENEMTERLTTKMEDLTGRRIVNYQSQVMFDPDVVVEMFVFDAEGSSDAIEATAQGQLEDAEQGVATEDQALDDPALGGP